MFAPLLTALVLAAPYTLHEWGTFTSVAGVDGVPVQWRPVSDAADLPTFVQRGDLRDGSRQNKGHMVGTVRMETPVIYFYAAEPTTVSLAVTFKGGAITEWYPWAKTFGGSRLDWGSFKVLPSGDPKTLLREPAPSHYYPAREVDASWVKVCSTATGVGPDDQWERFLFYRGVGSFGAPLTARLTDQGGLELQRFDGEVVVFQRSGAKVGVSRVTLKGTTTVLLPPLTSSVAEAQRLIRELLISSGLFDKEADAMLETWKDSWFEEGLRVISVVPRTLTDEVLPLEVSPAPEKMVRVLVGRLEVFTPTRVEAARKAVLKAGNAEGLGRFAGPLLSRAADTASSPKEKAQLEKMVEAGGGSSLW